MTRAVTGGLLLVVLGLAGCPGGGSGIDSHPDGGISQDCTETPGRTECDPGVCVDLNQDPENCGGCGHACDEPDRPYCVAGDCQERCGVPGQPLCGGRCVSLDSDPEHCGSCDRVCGGDTPLCHNGACVPICEAQCGDACPDFQTDPSHCGGCGIACTAGRRCDGGTCVSDELCPGQVLCDGECRDAPCECDNGEAVCQIAPEAFECADLSQDDHNCGDCGIACGPEQECVDGLCVAECGEGLTACGDACVDLHRDPAHCGRCDNPCGEGQICVNEECTDGQPVECDSCPCAECLERDDPPQSCCEVDGDVYCFAISECPED